MSERLVPSWHGCLGTYRNFRSTAVLAKVDQCGHSQPITVQSKNRSKTIKILTFSINSLKFIHEYCISWSCLPPISLPALSRALLSYLLPNFMFIFNNLKKIYCVPVVLVICVCVWSHTWLTEILLVAILLNKSNSLSSEGTSCCLEAVEHTVLCWLLWSVS